MIHNTTTRSTSFIQATEVRNTRFTKATIDGSGSVTKTAREHIRAAASRAKKSIASIFSRSFRVGHPRSASGMRSSRRASKAAEKNFPAVVKKASTGKTELEKSAYDSVISARSAFSNHICLFAKKYLQANPRLASSKDVVSVVKEAFKEIANVETKNVSLVSILIQSEAKNIERLASEIMLPETKQFSTIVSTRSIEVSARLALINAKKTAWTTSKLVSSKREAIKTAKDKREIILSLSKEIAKNNPEFVKASRLIKSDNQNDKQEGQAIRTSINRGAIAEAKLLLGMSGIAVANRKRTT